MLQDNIRALQLLVGINTLRADTSTDGAGADLKTVHMSGLIITLKIKKFSSKLIAIVYMGVYMT